ncbi:MAG: hypothetical protein J7K36_09050 [Archaeoglobaceae archaeon]|nr:hypothetical protein [Archaeoglobaceae archaeon]
MKRVEAWGTGRFDYTNDISAQVHPTIRAGQGFYSYCTYTTVPALTSIETTIPIESYNNIVIFDAYLSAPKNILIGLKYATVDSEGNENDVLYKQDYHSIRLIFESGLVFSNLKVTITNYDIEDHTLIYCHHGLYGTQEVVPIVE